MKFINEEFKYDNLDWEKRAKIFNIFKASYEEAVGTSWNEDKFRQRASNWLFFGDENGFVTVRPQQSGFYKLTGVAGGIKSIMKGLAELKAANLPIWGMATKELTNILVGRYGFKTPNKIESMVLMKMIPTNVFGGVDYKKNPDGSITFQYPDVGESTKFFVGNDAYYKKIKQQLGAKLNPFNLLKEDDEEVLDEKRAVEREAQSPIEILKSYVQRYGIENVFISFRESVNTSSINPRNRYNTPTGFYAYPIKYYAERNGFDFAKNNWQSFIGIFPFAGEREFVNIFTISRTDRILYTSQDNSSKINQFIQQIKLKYGNLRAIIVKNGEDEDNNEYIPPRETNLVEICDQFLAGKWQSEYRGDDGDGNNIPDNQLASFWLFLYYVAGLMRVGGKLANRVSIIAREIGLLGVCDDAGLGLIHSNEKAQIVLFYGFMNIISDYRVLSSRTQREDMPLPIDVKNRDKNMNSPADKIGKFVKHLATKMGVGDDNVKLAYDYYSDKEATKALESIKNNQPFTVRIMKQIHGHQAFLPFYVDRNGKPTVGNLNFADIHEYSHDSAPVDRAAFMNSINPDNARYLFVHNPDNNGYSRATMYDDYGKHYESYINKEGRPEVPKEFDFPYQSNSNMAAYLNTIAGYEKWRRIANFQYDNGEHGIGWLDDEKYTEYPVIVDKKGSIPENGMVKPINDEIGYNALAAQLNTVSKLAKFNGDIIHSYDITDTKIGVHYRSIARHMNFYEYFDLNGRPSIEGLNPDEIESGMRLAGYYNTLKNVELFTNVEQTNNDETYLAHTIRFHIQNISPKSFYINKLTGEPSLEGIVEDANNPYFDNESYDVTKELINKGLTVKEINDSIPADGTPPVPLPADDFNESLLDVISEALENLLTI